MFPLQYKSLNVNLIVVYDRKLIKLSVRQYFTKGQNEKMKLWTTFFLSTHFKLLTTYYIMCLPIFGYTPFGTKTTLSRPSKPSRENKISCWCLFIWLHYSGLWTRGQIARTQFPWLSLHHWTQCCNWCPICHCWSNHNQVCTNRYDWLAPSLHNHVTLSIWIWD